MATLNQLKKELFDKESRLSEARLIQERRKKKKAELEAKLRAQQAELLSKKEATDRLWRQEYAAQLPPVTDFITDVGPPSRPGDGDQRASEAALLDSLIAGEPTRDVVTEAPVLRGLTFNDPAYDIAGLEDGLLSDEAYDEAVADGEISEEKQVDLSSDFAAKLSQFMGGGGGFPQFPGDPSMSPQVLKNRQRLQKRRNVLRAFYGKAPKDITWSGGMTTTQLDNVWKRQVDQYLGQAFRATDPQTEGEVYMLGDSMNIPLSSWEKLFDFWKKSRPDYTYAKEMEDYHYTMKNRGLEEGVRALMGGAYRLYPDNPTERDKFVRYFFSRFPQYRTTNTLKLIKDNKDTFAEAAFDSKRFAIPFRFPTGEKWEGLLDDLGVPYEVVEDSDMKSPYEDGRDWIRVSPGHTVTLNPKDTEKARALSRLQGMPGFSEAKSTTQVFGIGPGGNKVTDVFDMSNDSWKDYVTYMSKHQGWKGTYPADVAGKMWETGEQLLGSKGYTNAKEDFDYAGNVLKIVGTIQGLDSKFRALAEAKNEEYIGIMGSKSGVSRVLSNLGALLEEWTGLELPTWADTLRDTVGQDAGARTLAIAQNGVVEFNNLENLGETGKDLQQMFSKSYQKNVDELNNPDLDEKDQARIMTNMMGIALATLTARLFSRNDRLLKQQYQDFRALMDLDGLFLSGDRAMQRINVIGQMASIFQEGARDKMGDIEQRASGTQWQRQPWGGYDLPESVKEQRRLDELRKQVDDL